MEDEAMMRINLTDVDICADVDQRGID